MVRYSPAHYRGNEALVAGPLLTNGAHQAARSRGSAKAKEVAAFDECGPGFVGSEKAEGA